MAHLPKTLAREKSLRILYARYHNSLLRNRSIYEFAIMNEKRGFVELSLYETFKIIFMGCHTIHYFSVQQELKFQELV